MWSIIGRGYGILSSARLRTIPDHNGCVQNVIIDAVYKLSSNSSSYVIKTRYSSQQPSRNPPGSHTWADVQLQAQSQAQRP